MVTRVQALAPDLATAQEGSRQNPPRYIAHDGKRYWLKANPHAAGPHNCLTAELLAGVLGHRLGATPKVAVVELSAAAAMPEHTAMVGDCFGSGDYENSLNIRQYASRGLVVPLARLDPEQAARVWAFQTWIGQGDWQCLIDSGDGRVYSIDHENWAAFEQPTAPVGEVSDHGELHDLGRDAAYVGPATAMIESLTETEILELVGLVPCSGTFEVPDGHMDAVAESLIRRRGEIRVSMQRWQR